MAPAARDDKQGRFAAGDAVGFVQDEMVCWGDPVETVRGVFERLADGAEILTCIEGADLPFDRARVESLAPATVELECHAGDQPHYWWLVAAE